MVTNNLMAQPNLLKSTEAEIKSEFSVTFYKGVDYTDKGVKYLSFSFPITNPEKYLEAIFLLDDNGYCSGANYYFPNGADIEGAVTALSAFEDFKKIPNTFGWYNQKHKFTIMIEKLESGGFVFQ